MVAFTVKVGSSVVLRELLPSGRYRWRAIAILACSPKAMVFKWGGKVWQLDKGEQATLVFYGNNVGLYYTRSHGEAVQIAFDAPDNVKIQRDGFIGSMRG